MNHSHLDSATSLCHLIGRANYRVVMFWNGMSTMHCGRWWKWLKNPYLFWDGRSGFFEDNPFWIHVAKPLGHLAIRDGWTVLKQHVWWSIIAGAHAPGCLAPMFSPFKVTPVFADSRFRRIPDQKRGGSWGVGELRPETELLRSRFWRRSKFRTFLAKPTDLTGKDPFVEVCSCLYH